MPIDVAIWDVRPFEAVGPFRHAMERDEVRRVLGSPVGEPAVPTSRDVFEHNGTYVLAHFEEDLTTLQAVEIETSPHVKIRFAGVLMHGSIAKIAERLAKTGVTLRGCEPGYDEAFGIPESGVWLWAPDGRRSPRTVCIDLVAIPDRVNQLMIPWQEKLDRIIRVVPPRSSRH